MCYSYLPSRKGLLTWKTSIQNLSFSLGLNTGTGRKNLTILGFLKCMPYPVFFQEFSKGPFLYHQRKMLSVRKKMHTSLDEIMASIKNSLKISKFNRHPKKAWKVDQLKYCYNNNKNKDASWNKLFWRVTIHHVKNWDRNFSMSEMLIFLPL